MSYEVVVETPKGMTSHFWDGSPLRIGRDAGCDLVIDDDEVSRRHLRLAVPQVSGRLSVEDLNSANGTFIAGRRITQATFTLPQTVHLGSRVCLHVRFTAVARAQRYGARQQRTKRWWIWALAAAALAMATRHADQSEPTRASTTTPELLRPPAIDDVALWAWSQQHWRDRTFAPGSLGLAAAGFARVATMATDSQRAQAAAAWAATAAAALALELRDLEFATLRAWRSGDRAAAARAAARWLAEAQSADHQQLQLAQAWVRRIAVAETGR